MNGLRLASGASTKLTGALPFALIFSFANLFHFVQPYSLSAQPIPIGDLRDTQAKFAQLFADTVAEYSFMNRPLSLNSDGYGLSNRLVKGSAHSRRSFAYRQSMWRTIDPFPSTPLLQAISVPGAEVNGLGLTTSAESSPNALERQNFRFGLYDLEFGSSYNSKLPYSENDGAAWAGKGFNSVLKTGIFITSRYLTITLRPEYSYAQNMDFTPPRFVPFNRSGVRRYAPEGYIREDSLAERIDMPYRFGPDSYVNFDLGQSSIRLHFKEFETGISTENVWWGPGVTYALTMSNHAAGLPHVFLGTRKPVNLPLDIGLLEFRWMLAKPNDSKYFDLGIHERSTNSYIAARQPFFRERFMNGLNITYSPSVMPNVFFNYTRITHDYLDGTMPTFEQATTVFRRFPRPDWEDVYSNFRHDQSTYEDFNTLQSVGMRWVFPEDHAEFYMEFYKESVHRNFRDFWTEPSHDRAYNVGFQYIVPSWPGHPFLDFLRLRAEFTNLVPTRLDDIRPQTYYYSHKRIKQGHTNEGQVLGASIGPGSDSQLIGFDFFLYKGMLGLFVQRVAVNDHFHYELSQRYIPGTGYKDYWNQWVNLNIGSRGMWRIGHITLEGAATWNKNFNYGRQYFLRSWNGSREQRDVINWKTEFTARYRF